MAQKMTGALVFDERTDRYDIRFDLNSYYGGLHCGECFDVFVRGNSCAEERLLLCRSQLSGRSRKTPSKMGIDRIAPKR